MSVDQRHPQYQDYVSIWETMRDCEAGEDAVKQATEKYLPMPSGFKQSLFGNEMYEAYKARAVFPDILQPTLEGMLGVIHRVEAQISGLEENKPLAYMWERATRYDELPLEAFHKRITAEILLMGRYAILTDVPSDNSGEPYLAGYSAEKLINWSQYERELFVLDESRLVLGGDDEFTWTEEKSFRVLRLVDGQYQQQVYDENSQGGEIIVPVLRGQKDIGEIPFVVVGPRELTSRNIERPPLLGVGRASLAIYRLDADYRHQMFNSGQETAVIIGETENIPKVMGSGVIVGLPTGADAKYIGPSGVGINAHRQAILDERQSAVAAGVKLFDTQAKAESGEALRLRASAQTATLTTIAQASAAALEKALRYAAMFVGQNPDEIVVKPNLQFVDTKMTTAEAKDLVTVWMSGGMSKQSLFENLQKGELITSERTYDEEEALIEAEKMADQALLNQMQPAELGGPNPRLNGGTLPARIPSRFIEDGTGLKIE